MDELVETSPMIRADLQGYGLENAKHEPGDGRKNAAHVRERKLMSNFCRRRKLFQ
jgi:hypothetical protein